MSLYVPRLSWLIIFQALLCLIPFVPFRSFVTNDMESNTGHRDGPIGAFRSHLFLRLTRDGRFQNVSAKVIPLLPPPSLDGRVPFIFARIRSNTFLLVPFILISFFVFR